MAKMVLSHRVCHSSVRPSKYHWESKTDSLVSLTLQINLATYKREETFCFSSFFLRSLAFSKSRASKFVCNLSVVIEYAVLGSAIDFADSISLNHTIASICRLPHKDTSLLKLVRQILKFLKSSQASNSNLSASLFWEFLCLSTF